MFRVIDGKCKSLLVVIDEKYNESLLVVIDGKCNESLLIVNKSYGIKQCTWLYCLYHNKLQPLLFCLLKRGDFCQHTPILSDICILNYYWKINITRLWIYIQSSSHIWSQSFINCNIMSKPEWFYNHHNDKLNLSTTEQNHPLRLCLKLCLQ